MWATHCATRKPTSHSVIWLQPLSFREAFFRQERIQLHQTKVLRQECCAASFCCHGAHYHDSFATFSIALAIISVSQLVLSGCGCCNIMSGLYLALTCILCTHLRHSFRTIFVMAPMVEESVNAHHTSTHALFLVNSYAQKTSSQTGPRCNGTLVAKPQWRTRGTPLHNGKESWIRYKIFNTQTAQYQICT